MTASKIINHRFLLKQRARWDFQGTKKLLLANDDLEDVFKALYYHSDMTKELLSNGLNPESIKLEALKKMIDEGYFDNYGEEN